MRTIYIDCLFRIPRCLATIRFRLGDVRHQFSYGESRRPDHRMVKFAEHSHFRLGDVWGLWMRHVFDHTRQTNQLVLAA